MKIGVIIAMDSEYRKMEELLGGASVGVLGNNEVVLWQCGIGKVNAAVGTVDLIRQHKPDCIISTGLAGGIDNLLSVGDVLVARNAVYHDVWCGPGNEYGQIQGLPTLFGADEGLLAHAELLASSDSYGCKMGLICTGDKFITSPEEIAVIKSQFPDGYACDMESAAIAHVCHLFGVPFMSVRIISDTPGNTDNHQMQWEEFLATMSAQSFRWIRNFLESL